MIKFTRNLEIHKLSNLVELVQPPSGNIRYDFLVTCACLGVASLPTPTTTTTTPIPMPTIPTVMMTSDCYLNFAGGSWKHHSAFAKSTALIMKLVSQLLFSSQLIDSLEPSSVTNKPRPFKETTFVWFLLL